jgi:hypothetical protein
LTLTTGISGNERRCVARNRSSISGAAVKKKLEDVEKE